MFTKFMKDYPVIVRASITSLIIIVLYSLFAEQLTCMPVERIANVLFQFSIGIIINAVFFYTQIFLAQKKQREYTDKGVVARIDAIQRRMRDIFGELGEKYLENYKEGCPLDEQQLLLLLQRTVSIDSVQVIDPSKFGRVENPKYSVADWIIYNVRYVEREIDRLCSYYNQYVSPELLEVLDKILASTMHNNLARNLMVTPNGVRFAECNDDIFYKPYYALIDELEEMKKQYM